MCDTKEVIQAIKQIKAKGFKCELIGNDYMIHKPNIVFKCPKQEITSFIKRNYL